MSKNLQNSVLLDLYGCLLTDKQNEIMDLYYNDDLSLGEIAAQLDISRQGVHDAIQKCETAMADYEESGSISSYSSDVYKPAQCSGREKV